MLTDIHVALERVVMAEAARFPALARNLYEFGVGRPTRLVAEVLRKAEERGEIRVSDANFAAEQFISSVILSPFRRAALGVGVTSHNETSSARMRQAVDLFVYGCSPSQQGSHPLHSRLLSGWSVVTIGRSEERPFGREASITFASG